jgi:hypothetical protein
MEKQRTLDGRLVPVAPHRDDIIETEDGEFIRYGDIEYTDCRGRVFSNEEDRDDSDDDIVREILDAQDEWIGDYVSSDDYGDGYAYVVCEDTYRWKDPVREWICDNYSDGGRYSSRSIFDGELEDALVDGLIENLDDYNLEACYNSNEYACYSGSGCAVDSFEVGEYEDQIDVNGRDEFEVLYEEGRLRDCLNRYNGDLCVRCDNHDLREPYPCFYGYSNGWGRWHYVFSDESMEQALVAAIIGR